MDKKYKKYEYLYNKHIINKRSISNKMTLYNIIIKDYRFLDENNLITCCKGCHINIH